MSVYPTQERVVDPFSSYHSNVVNRFTRLISRGNNCLHSPHAIDVSLDSTSPLTTVVVSTGQCFKDDVLISITAEHSVDFEDQTNYVSFGGGFNESGYYYIVLDYTYIKSKPAPQAAIKILKPSQDSLLSADRYFFLKAVYVQWNGVSGSMEIVSVHDQDNSKTPYTIGKAYRIFSQLYMGLSRFLPTSFNTDNDEGRLIYVIDEDEVYYGASGHWEPMNAVRAARNTLSVSTAGKLGYIKSDGTVGEAISTSPLYFADCVVTQLGAEDGDGMVRLYGPVDNVPVESGITMAVGESCYLSASDSGTITNLIPGDYSQYVGVVIAAGSVAGTWKIWFMPNAREENAYSPNWFDQYQNLLLNSVYERMTVDTFINEDLVDTLETDAELNTSLKRYDGTVGETFQSEDLVESGYNSDGSATVIVSCQLSADYSGDIDWYVTNNGDVVSPDWEGPMELDAVHDFSTVKLHVTNGNLYNNNEIVTGSLSGKTGIIVGRSSNYIYLRNVIMATEFTVFENIVGSESAVSQALQEAQTNRQSDEYQDIRVKAEFNGTGYINDYALLYDEDESILDTTPENEYNIQTLFHDVYTNPSIDDDGDPNLDVPLQTKIDGYLHTEDGTACTIWTVNHNLKVQDRIACVVCTDLSYNLLVPSTIYFDSTDTLTITFSSAQTGYAKVRG